MIKLRIILIVYGICLLSVLPGCKKDENNPSDNNNKNNNEDPQTETRTRLTTGTWSLTAATRDDVDVSSEYEGFTINFTSMGFFVVNGGIALPDTGTWTFDGTSTDRIIFNGDLSVTLSFSDNDSSLRITFTLPETDYSLGRKEQLAGVYEFDLAQ